MTSRLWLKAWLTPHSNCNLKSLYRWPIVHIELAKVKKLKIVHADHIVINAYIISLCRHLYLSDSNPSAQILWRYLIDNQSCGHSLYIHYSNPVKGVAQIKMPYSAGTQEYCIGSQLMVARNFWITPTIWHMDCLTGVC